MSTYIYLQCLDHEPRLTADRESGQHLYNLPQLGTVLIAHRDQIADFEITDYYRSNTAAFLVQHPTCRLGIVDEYGEIHPLTDEDGAE